MRRFIISLVLIFGCSFLCSAQKYQGSVSASATVMGFAANTSQGVRINQDYFGVGAEAGIWTLLLLSREWYSAFVDYQHYFPIGNKASIYLQASPGASWTSFTTIADSVESTNKEYLPDEGIRACAKLGVGIDWQWNVLGLGISLQNNLFAPQSFSNINKTVCWIPSVQVTLHW